MSAPKPEPRIDAATLAVLMTDAPDAAHGLGLGRTWSPSVGAKRVRSIARDTLPRYIERTGYTAHAYTLDEAAAIVEAAADHGRGSGTVNADAIRALSASKTASKPATKRTRTTKPATATKPVDGPQDAS